MITPQIGNTILRIMVASIFIIHAIHRSLIAQTVDRFGEFFESLGVPFGVYLAWAVTLYEFAGGILLTLNRYTRYIALGFMLHQVMGIALVHLTRGWFVVGAANGGAEYSVLILAALIAIIANSKSRY